jgi:hypothetical protein
MEGTKYTPAQDATSRLQHVVARLAGLALDRERSPRATRAKTQDSPKMMKKMLKNA